MKTLPLLCLLLLVALLMVLRLASLQWEPFLAVDMPDQCDLAQIARNFSRGDGFVTQVVGPKDWQLGHRNPIEERQRTPLLPLLMAGAFWLYGVSDIVAILPSMVSTLGLAILLYLFFYRSTQQAWVSAAASLLFFLHPRVLELSVTALSTMLQSALFLLLLWVLFYSTAKGRMWALGILLAALYSCNRLFIYLWPALTLCLYLMGGWRRPALVLQQWPLHVALFASLWLVQSVLGFEAEVVASSDYRLLYFTKSFPHLSLLRSLTTPPPLWEWVRQNPGELLDKYARFATWTRQSLFNAWMPVVSSWILFSLLPWRCRNRSENILLLFVVATFALLLLSLPLLVYDYRYYFHYGAPLYFLAVVVTLRGVAALRLRARLAPLALAALALFYVSLCHPARLLPPYRQLHFNFYPELAKWLDEHSDKSQLLVTGAPAHLAWYADRPTILIPNTLAELEEMQKASPRPLDLLLDSPSRGSSYTPLNDFETLLKPGDARQRLNGRDYATFGFIVDVLGAKFWSVLYRPVQPLRE